MFAPLLEDSPLEALLDKAKHCYAESTQVRSLAHIH
jgi:hypothetical protein